ncbi:sugar transferase [Micromonospora eburnea]|uniref:Sugar transferase involved in LPS biosynthesis (Colanic, teichoic acid) n=1 Tax=Micromonospora eburnea TaxID=227316 RepID=A0A1C6U435_9ACTN|nr:sugar transferase [Micromonospora eburnea]SCL48802.1 Sugar transferase involved in LPS biosynthesis (colanic, teichoic acid) [Micromonospora eburnea]
MIGDRRAYDLCKRGMDVILAGVALIVLAPILLVVGVAVALALGRPVLFRQLRPGREGRLFELRKFRTMLPVSVDRHRDEDRLTPFGVWLRRTSLDELPTLWNVLRGDMSLVGPRPLMPEYLSRYTPEQARRHEVRPGITGLAQIHGRNALSWEEKFTYDVRYVDSRSLWLDLRILLVTVVKVLRHEGISAEGHATMPEFVGSGRSFVTADRGGTTRGSTATRRPR